MARVLLCAHPAEGKAEYRLMPRALEVLFRNHSYGTASANDDYFAGYAVEVLSAGR